MNFQGDIFSIPIVNFGENFVLVFDLTSMQDDFWLIHYPKLVGGLLRQELIFTFIL